MQFVRNKLAYWIFILSIIYAIILILWLRFIGNTLDSRFLWIHQIWLPWFISAFLLMPLYRSPSYVFELMILWGAWFFFPSFEPYQIPIHFSLVTITLMLACYPIPHRGVQACVPIISLAWLAYWIPDCPWQQFNLGSGFIIVATLAGLGIYSYDNLRRTEKMSGIIDVILCSNSGNTAAYFEQFQESADHFALDHNIPIQWQINRFHYYRNFSAQLSGNGLVLAFPVSGWKPPWHLCAYLIFRLPYGHGKPAWILYTSSCGPENAGFVAWLLLTLKGYRVVSRQWAGYPINVVTFRIGTANFWKRLDQTQPVLEDIANIQEVARAWVLGDKQGLPIFILPFPMIIFGILLDNKYFNMLFYRNYVWQRRCIQCRACVNVCPVQRLQINKQGYPTPKGSCTICMSCINECPNNAMQMMLWTEYGQQYLTRWPQYVVRHPEELQKTNGQE